ncbi:IucA/IucC family C-terminal-domain containing protein [Halovivax cerinus]|uniref:IucA/IucC family C-terminal-domain containing protein n=1 Tax=Halovivax cerinus TaxID=1487865 RepID=A0ABD5NIM8_9EURY|nr:IucA/IucC family C-terminal-domain containing protein [Halovivax cerinus]
MRAAALLAHGPLTDRPLLDSLVPEGGADAAAAFLRRYAEAIVPDALRLLVAYGVGLEAHLQNCVVVFDEWKPKRVLVRDYGGLRLCTDRLAEHGCEFEPYPGSVTVDEGVEPAYDKLTYALFQNHLAELVRVLVRYRSIDESRCWALLSEIVADTLAELRQDGIPDEWVADAETVLYDATWNYKCLTTMRLTDRSHHYALESVPNPLCPPER